MSTKNQAVNQLTEKDTTDQVVFDDLSIIPFKEDSFGLCELCGRIGRRNDFYARNKKVCSLRCHVSSTRRKVCNWRFKMMEGTEHMAGMIPLEPLPQLLSWHASFDELQAGPLKHNSSAIPNSYEWMDELFGCDFLAAPVSLFKHAPLHDMWDNTFEGMKVEVKNSDCENLTEKLGDYFWVASVLKVKGYMGLLRYEGFGSDDSKDFWVNLCCAAVHPVGWCATLGKPLIPPKSIEEKYADWKKYLVKQLTGARTLPANFYSKLKESLKSRFAIGTVMEIVDKSRIAQVKVASVTEAVGKRLQFRYYDSASNDDYFWCHEDSPLIHPVGWAFRIGHLLDAPPAYCQRVAAGRLLPNDATFDMFNEYPNEPALFTQGMKIEAIDPLNLSSICAATVMQILNEGYMMIKIDCYPADETCGDWFCYHQRSPYIFPAGFAQASNIPMKPPLGYSPEQFTWEGYLSASGQLAAPRALFAARSAVVQHGFVAGMRLECVDLMDPKLVCIATVDRVVADLLKIHFDGWGAEYDQWLWAYSTDMYPVGWARAAGHRLEGPQRAAAPRAPRARRPPRPSRRRKRPHVPPANHPPTPEDSSQNSDSLAEPPTKSNSPMTTASEISGDVDTRHSETSEQNSEQVPVKTPEQNREQTPEQSSEHNSEDVSEQNSVQTSEQASERMETNDKDGDDSAASTEMTAESEAHTSTTASEAPQEMDSQEEITQVVTPRTETQSDKVIPRLVKNSSVPLGAFSSVDPENWTPADVAEFLTVNDCQPYCVNFTHITGPMMLQLTKDEIIELLEMKVGPSLKIFDLIQQLKCKIKQPQRILSSFK